MDPKLNALVKTALSITESMGLAADSPAIDQGSCDTATDQEGFQRIVDNASIANATGGNGCDIGADER